jgi:uncharacterized 2Fe-2S/4Fe-4S cluster protein (DUF4445 family)
VRIDWQPLGRRVDVAPGTSLIDAARLAGVDLTATCGGIGLCEGCRVRVIAGRLSPISSLERSGLSDETVGAGWRLACQATVESDLTIDVPPDSLSAPQRLQIEGQTGDVAPDPVVQSVELAVGEPTLDDLRDDLGRVGDDLVARGFERPRAGLHVLADLPVRLRRQEWSASLGMRGPEIVAVLPRGTRLLGLAVDIGTTKLASYLVDLASGRTLAAVGRMNPQIARGEDVISRIAYVDHDAGRGRELQSLVVAALNEMLAELVETAVSSRDGVVDAVIVGNTAMHHLVAGLPVAQLGQAPYVPVVASALEIAARDIGLEVAPGASVYFPPNIAGYVGGDHVAMLLATSAVDRTGTSVAIDIGTNTEMTVTVGERRWTCSCASGPAFEGAHISHGMRAAPGAIERVVIVGAEVRVHTIGRAPAVGICGSGILDAVAEMWRAGILDRHGAIRPGHPATRAVGTGTELLVVPAAETGLGRDITVTRRDVTEIQLAKAAIRTGLDTLLGAAGVDRADVDRVVVAGAFGTYLDIRRAIEIGMLPDFPRAHIEQVGNAAGAGARQMLISADCRRRAESMVRDIEYVELTTHPAFADIFARAIGF